MVFRGLVSRKKCHSRIPCPRIREISPFLVKKRTLGHRCPRFDVIFVSLANFFVWKVKKREISDLLMGQKMAKLIVPMYIAGPFNVVFDKESNGGWENTVAGTVLEIQLKYSLAQFVRSITSRSTIWLVYMLSWPELGAPKGQNPSIRYLGQSSLWHLCQLLHLHHPITVIRI